MVVPRFTTRDVKLQKFVISVFVGKNEKLQNSADLPEVPEYVKIGHYMMASLS